MFKHIIQFSLVISVLVLASCSGSENPENPENPEKVENQSSGANHTPAKRPEKEIPYPELFSQTDIPLIDGGFVLNKKELKNTKNRTGMQLWERSDKSFEDVKAFYLENIQKNGWERKTDADKQSTPEQENDEAPVKYFVTKFHKDIRSEKKKYVLLINITSGNNGSTTVIKIIKEM